MPALVIVAQVLVPVALLAWLAVGRPRTRASWLARAGIAAGWLVAIATTGLWLAIPQATVGVYGLALVAAVVVSFRRTRRAVWWPERPLPRAGTVVLATVALGMVLFAGRTLSWRSAPPGPAVELRFPLRDGTYLVVNGGSSNVNNGHVGIPETARGRYRGQTRAVDLIGIDLLGRRSDGLAPADPASYRIFGDTIHAPCAGTVVTAVDGLPDQRPPDVDREHMAGNHVILECAGTAPGLETPGPAPEPADTAAPAAPVWVLLGHMMRGSVGVSEGQAVDVGQPLGRVGNTGNSDEPHLHIHAQRPGTRGNPLGADPLVVRFDGRYLARNDRVAGSLHRQSDGPKRPDPQHRAEGDRMSAPSSDQDRDRIPDIRTIYEESGESGLRKALEGLDRDDLEDVVRAHPPHHTAPPSMQSMSRDELVGYIVDGVEREADDG